MIVSPSVSFVAAGVASGICLLLLSTIRKRRSADSKENSKRIVPVDDSRCGCCLKPFLIGRGVECSDCGIRSCRTACSRWDTIDNAWHCLFCHQRRSWLRRNEKWFEVFGGADIEEELHHYFSTAKSKVYVEGVENVSVNSSLDLAEGGKEEKNTMETVRNFVEKIVESIIGNVDNTPIDRLYAHPAYDWLLGKYNAPLAEALVRLTLSLQLCLTTDKADADPPAMAHRALCELVERAVDEARKLPALGSSGDASRSEEGRSIGDKSYEDLLATAILNKVIEKVQQDNVDGNSNVLHEQVTSRTKSTIGASELGLDKGVDEGNSSLEPLSPDECDHSLLRSRKIRSQPEPVSLMIEERIEEVTTTYASDEENREPDDNVLLIGNARRVPFPEYGMDIVDPLQESSEESQDEDDKEDLHSHVALVTPVESWEENWLFQKKKVHARADAVAMLVPNPSEDFKALIGDKDAEDTSDLSECSSAQSDEEIEMELQKAIDNVVPRSPKNSESEGHTRVSDNLSNYDTENIHDDDPTSTSTSPLTTIVQESNTSKEISASRPGLVSEKSTTKIVISSFDNEGVYQTVSCNGSMDLDEVEITNTSKDDDEPSKEHSEETQSENTDVIKSTDDVASSVEEANDVSQGEANSRASDDIHSTYEETTTGVPKTPNPTPARTPVTETQEENLVKTDATSDEIILSSLESAKEKLLHTNEKSATSSSLGEDEAQQESEYTEHYDSAIQRHMDSLTKTAQGEVINEHADHLSTIQKNLSAEDVQNCSETATVATNETVSEKSAEQNQAEEDPQLTAPPRPGTIAEREHRKWENAAPIENNPYSEENIQKRLWERQYARRLSDIPGSHTELSKDLDALESTQPDIQRFGRDYYINQSKSSSGERTRKSPVSNSSRPGSSLSQRSDSIGTDHERQEGTSQKEPDVSRVRSNDVKAKVAKWQQNNAEANRPYSTQSRSQELSGSNAQQQNVNATEEKYLEKHEKNWQDDGMDNFLENERKNSKNEINAKLNNQENTYGKKGIMETKKTYANETQRTIRRIDLKAYGFEKDFGLNSSESVKTSTQRVVNKLDLKSFGYDDGLRRCQSNNHLDGTVEGEFKPRVVSATNKSNLMRYSDQKDSGDSKTNDRKNSVRTKSTETLNNLQDDVCTRFGSMVSAKSVPNIANSALYTNSSDCQRFAKGDNYDKVKNVHARHDPVTTLLLEEKCVRMNDDCRAGRVHRDRTLDSLNGSVESEIAESSLEDDTSMNSQDPECSVENINSFIEKDLAMPSVKTLAQAFSASPESVPLSTPKLAKSNGTTKGRASTPDVEISRTPKQMHSLTARSLSKQFREGLRQIPNKVTSPPASHVTMESPRSADDRRQIVRTRSADQTSDVAVISPGKLKSNIIFWEELQRRS